MSVDKQVPTSVIIMEADIDSDETGTTNKIVRLKCWVRPGISVKLDPFHESA